MYVPKVTPPPPNAPRGSNAQQTPSWEVGAVPSYRFQFGVPGNSTPIPSPKATRLRCDKCGRFVSESGDDTVVVGGTSTYSHQLCPPVEPDTWCLECVRKVKPELYKIILDDNILR